MSKELDLYYASTPNGWKIEIALEEMGIPYKVLSPDHSNQLLHPSPTITSFNYTSSILPHLILLQLHQIDMSKNEQFDPEYLKISPNNKIPCLVDPNAQGGPLSIFESGAILIYLGKYLLSPPSRSPSLPFLLPLPSPLSPLFSYHP